MSGQTEFTPEVGDVICGHLIEGKSIRKLCQEDGMPAPSTVFKWLRENPAFSEQYARAREDQAETLADEIIDIADDSKLDKVEGKYDAEAVARSKLRVDARKWVAAKLKPKKYGDKTLLGSDPDNPLPEGFAVNLVKPSAGS